MGGLYVDCGSFQGSTKKSGRSILFVLEGMKAFADDEARALLTRLMHDVEAWTWAPPKEFNIAPHDARVLLPSIYKYRQHIEGLLPSLDENDIDITMSEERASELNYSGPAHQYDFFRDLVPALEMAVAEHQPVVLTWD
jgi:hypothetical protein